MQQLIPLCLTAVAIKVSGVLIANEPQASQKSANVVAIKGSGVLIAESAKAVKVTRAVTKPLLTALAPARLRTQKLNASYEMTSNQQFNHNKINQTKTNAGKTAAFVSQTLAAKELVHNNMAKKQATAKHASSPAVHMMNATTKQMAPLRNHTYTIHIAEPGVTVADAQCACEFHGTCSCQATMDFMDCIADSCASGKCDCNAQQYQHACYTMADECPSLNMQCTRERAVCLFEREGYFSAVKQVEKNKTTEDLYEELKDLKERTCRLQMAAEDGWLNSEKQLTDVKSRIDKAMSVLQSRGEKTPAMHCGKHFEEWTYPESSKPHSGALPMTPCWLGAVALVTLVVGRA